MALFVGTDSRNENPRPVERDEAHVRGLVHRAVHVEIMDQAGRLLVWLRRDGRLEIPGGHVDWLETEDRAESYDEAVVRELDEELALWRNWALDSAQVRSRLARELSGTTLVANQLPSSTGNNNEWVQVYRLAWQPGWTDPVHFILGEEEGASHARWTSIEDLATRCERNVGLATASLRLLLCRRGIMIPLPALTDL